MLQQTQVDRVVPKFEAFIAAFPNEASLAEATLADVLKLWNGLGYNRRAKFLHEAAKKIILEFDGKFPETQDGLISLPGVGVNTAGAILAYSFDQPVVFIETNVRTVYFHHFFENSTNVSDKELREVVEQTIDMEHPREWYWAIMDYGSYLKRQGAGQNDKSRHYKRQPALKGSMREVRGQIVRELTIQDMELKELRRAVQADERFAKALESLSSDGLIKETDGRLHLAR
ncbi:MAG: A/G-specific adenine glycosylase [Candidatus Saccharimonadaceae bacterium]